MPKYLNKHETSPGYVAAVLLNPGLKWTGFKKEKKNDRKNVEYIWTYPWRNEYRSNTHI